MKKTTIEKVINFASLKFSGSFLARKARTNAAKAKMARYAIGDNINGRLPTSQTMRISSCSWEIWKGLIMFFWLIGGRMVLFPNGFVWCTVHRQCTTVRAWSFIIYVCSTSRMWMRDRIVSERKSWRLIETVWLNPLFKSKIQCTKSKSASSLGLVSLVRNDVAYDAYDMVTL